jgi:hypothetical protein
MSVKTNEFALLAQDTYEDRTIYKDQNKIITIGDRKYRVLDTENDRLTGYQGTAYQKLDANGHPTGEVIIAHRGSEFDRELLKDGFIADGGMVLAGLNAQAAVAQAFTERVMAKARAAAKAAHVPLEVTVTGHSLGGALAQLTAYKFHLYGETFNAYGTADLGYHISQGGDFVTNYVRTTDVVSAVSHHFGKVVVLATADDIHRLEHNGYHEHVTTRNPLGAVNVDAHSITNFIDQPGRPSDLSAENEARARAHQSAISLYREDMRDLRANVFSLAWRLAQKKETALTLGAATTTALLHGDRDTAQKLASVAAHRAVDNVEHAAHVATNTTMLGITAIDQTGAYVADHIKQGLHALDQAVEPMTRAIHQAGTYVVDHVKHDVQQLGQSAQQAVQPFVEGVAHYSNAARGVPVPPESQEAAIAAQTEPSPQQHMLQELQRLQEQLHRLQSQYMPEPSMSSQRNQEQPVLERDAATISRVDVSTITPHSSIDDMFEALYQASVTKDHAAMSAVSQAYLQSDHGQAWLQMGRDYNEQLERQQALEQQMVRKGPSMSR